MLIVHKTKSEVSTVTKSEPSKELLEEIWLPNSRCCLSTERKCLKEGGAVQPLFNLKTHSGDNDWAVRSMQWATSLVH